MEKVVDNLFFDKPAAVAVTKLLNEATKLNSVRQNRITRSIKNANYLSEVSFNQLWMSCWYF